MLFLYDEWKDDYGIRYSAYFDALYAELNQTSDGLVFVVDEEKDLYLAIGTTNSSLLGSNEYVPFIHLYSDDYETSDNPKK